MDIPKNERTFQFKKTGDLYGKIYEGAFTVKCILTILDKRMLEIEKSRLKLDIKNPSPDLVAWATILANLRVRIIKSPDWWKESNYGDNIEDEEIVTSLFEDVMAQEEAWREELKAKLPKEDTAGN